MNFISNTDLENRKNLNDQMRGWYSEFCVGIFDLIAHNYFVQKHTLL